MGGVFWAVGLAVVVGSTRALPRTIDGRNGIFAAWETMDDEVRAIFRPPVRRARVRVVGGNWSFMEWNIRSKRRTQREAAGTELRPRHSRRGGKARRARKLKNAEIDISGSGGGGDAGGTTNVTRRMSR